MCFDGLKIDQDRAHEYQFEKFIFQTLFCGLSPLNVSAIFLRKTTRTSESKDACAARKLKFIKMKDKRLLFFGFRHVFQCIFTALYNQLIEGNVVFICKLLQLFNQSVRHANRFVRALRLLNFKHFILHSAVLRQCK